MKYLSQIFSVIFIFSLVIFSLPRISLASTVHLNPQSVSCMTVGDFVPVSWSDASADIDHFSLQLSTDAGLTYENIASQISGTTYQWSVPNEVTEAARLKITGLSANNDVLASDTSPTNFNIAISCLATDTTAPVISAIGSSNITASAATISWNTNSNASSQVVYDTASHDSVDKYAKKTTPTVVEASPHTVTLSQLSPGTTYYYRVVAADDSGNAASSDEKWFTTSGTTSSSSTDVTKPSTPQSLKTTVVNRSQINLTWTASTDNNKVSGYYIFRDGQEIGLSVTNNFYDAGLTANTSYRYTLESIDPDGNRSAPTAEQKISTNNVAPIESSPSLSAPTISNININGTDYDPANIQNITLPLSKKYIFKGLALADSTITFTLSSKKQLYKVQSNSNGQWQFIPPFSLNAGNHVLMGQINDAKGHSSQNLTLVNFSLSPNPTGASTSASTSLLSKIISALITIFLIAAVITAFIIVRRREGKKKSKSWLKTDASDLPPPDDAKDDSFKS